MHLFKDCAPNCRDCYYNGMKYSHGSTKCINGINYICEDGTWENAGTGPCYDVQLGPNCTGVGYPPNYTPSAPTTPRNPYPDELNYLVNRWTFIWDCYGGKDWIFVKELKYDYYQLEWYIGGCHVFYYNGSWYVRYLYLWRTEICGYFIHY